jgi:hypothetical protein
MEIIRQHSTAATVVFVEGFIVTGVGNKAKLNVGCCGVHCIGSLERIHLTQIWWCHEWPSYSSNKKGNSTGQMSQWMSLTPSFVVTHHSPFLQCRHYVGAVSIFTLFNWRHREHSFHLLLPHSSFALREKDESERLLHHIKWSNKQWKRQH